MSAAGDLDDASLGTAPRHLRGNIGKQKIRRDAAQHQGRRRDAVIVLPLLVVLRMREELTHDRRVVMRRDIAIGQAAEARFGHMPPLRIRMGAERHVDRLEVGFELAERGEFRRAADIGLDALVGRLWKRWPDIVDDQAPDATGKCRRGHADAERPAHRGAQPVDRGEAQAVGQRPRRFRIDGEAIVAVGRAAPLRQAAADGIRTDHEPAVGECGGNLVEVASGAGKPVPHDERRRPA